MAPYHTFKRTTLLAVFAAIAMLFCALTVSLSWADSTHAINVINGDNTGSYQGEFQKVNDEGKKTNAYITNITNTLLYVLGFIAVIAIIIAGIMYTTSNGDQSKIKQSKDIIMYAVIGLIVAIMAWAIVNFVVSRF